MSYDVVLKGEDPREFYVNLHNERVRRYWNYRVQSITCRVRFTEKGGDRSRNFRLNIIDFLYNHNLKEFDEISKEIYEEDQKVINSHFGIKEGMDKKEQFSKAMMIRDSSKHSIISILKLNNIVATKLFGYYIELFYLKCYLKGLTPQFILRCLYHLKINKPHFDHKVIFFENNFDLKKHYLDEISIIIRMMQSAKKK
jgi:hypothetical protein